VIVSSAQPQQDGLVPIPQTGTSVQARRFTLTAPGGKEFAIAVAIDDTGDSISQAIANGTFSFPPTYQLLFSLAKPGATILDLGANIGTFSLAAAAMGCRVYAVEASPAIAARLNKSVAWNGFDNMRVVSAAVSDHVGTLEFLPAGPYGHVAQASAKAPAEAPGDSRIRSLRAITVDALLAELGLTRVDLVKMDIEGSEVAACRGMRGLLSGPDAPVIIYEANGHTLSFFGETPNRLIAALEAYGYRNYLIEPGQLLPVHSRDLQPDCIVDYLATRQPLAMAGAWQVTQGMTQQQMTAKALATCAYPHEHFRIYIARALASANKAVLANPEVQTALDRLAADPDAGVRAAAAWHLKRRKSWLRRLFS
jgi:FkbM family methyltransferase